MFRSCIQLPPTVPTLFSNQCKFPQSEYYLPLDNQSSRPKRFQSGSFFHSHLPSTTGPVLCASFLPLLPVPLCTVHRDQDFLDSTCCRLSLRWHARLRRCLCLPPSHSPKTVQTAFRIRSVRRHQCWRSKARSLKWLPSSHSFGVKETAAQVP